MRRVIFLSTAAVLAVGVIAPDGAFEAISLNVKVYGSIYSTFRVPCRCVTTPGGTSW